MNILVHVFRLTCALISLGSFDKELWLSHRLGFCVAVVDTAKSGLSSFFFCFCFFTLYSILGQSYLHLWLQLLSTLQQLPVYVSAQLSQHQPQWPISHLTSPLDIPRVQKNQYVASQIHHLTSWASPLLVFLNQWAPTPFTHCENQESSVMLHLLHLP